MQLVNVLSEGQTPGAEVTWVLNWAAELEP
jgi:hypothetical protein